MSSIANWDLKAALARQLWEYALQLGMWHDRLKELRGYENLTEKHADSKLAYFFQEWLHSQGDTEFTIGLYAVILPAYRAALHRYIDETSPQADWATVRLIRHVLLDIDAHIAFGETVLAAPSSRRTMPA